MSFYLPYCFKLVNTPKQQSFNDVKLWCDTVCQGKFSFLYPDGGYRTDVIYFYFEKASDAAMFKLSWMI
jgi:hypothetical protein